MILYALACAGGHAFESWFRSSDAFDIQAEAGHVACPVCGSTAVTKALMSPALVGGRPSAAPSEPATPAAAGASERTDTNVALLDEGSRELRSLLRQVREKLVTEGHDVGRAFASEARRIHDGEAPLRQIYGQASVAEARELLEDGIAVLPMPIVPDDLN